MKLFLFAEDMTMYGKTNKQTPTATKWIQQGHEIQDKFFFFKKSIH